MKTYRKVIQLGNSLAVTIPKGMVLVENLKKGDWVECVEIKKVR